MQNKTKFAIGDRVRVIMSSYNDIQTNKYIGQEGFIEVTTDSYSKIKVLDNKTFDNRELELIPSIKTLENLECGDIVKSMTDQELDSEIKRLRELEDENNREGWNISKELLKLLTEKQRRWAKTLSPEELSNL
jgi:hypothetical protein